MIRKIKSIFCFAIIVIIIVVCGTSRCKKKKKKTVMAIYKKFKNKVHSNLFAELNEDLDSLTYTWLIKDIGSLTTGAAGGTGSSLTEIQSELFPIHGYWFKARARLELNPDGFVYASLVLTNPQKRRFFKLLNFVGQLPVPRARYVLKNQEEGASDLVRSRNNLLGHYLFYNTPTYRMRLGERAILSDPSYNAEDSLVLEVHVEPPSVSARAFCADGSVTWKVDGYFRCKELARKQLLVCQQSPYFYTRLKGHRVVVELRLNGQGSFEGKGLTAAICFLTGKFDLALSDTYRQESELVLINQWDPSKSIRKSVKGKLSQEKRYSMDMATHEVLEKEGFLKNDALIFKVRVKTSAFSFLNK